MIYVELSDGGRRRTKEVDRKQVVLERLRRYLETGEAQGPTVYPASVLGPRPLAVHPDAQDRLFYGHYDKTHQGLLRLVLITALAAHHQHTGADLTRWFGKHRIAASPCWTVVVASGCTSRCRR